MVGELIIVRIAKKNGENNMSFILGLTGGISSGKSTVSDYIKQFNIPVIDADLVSREVVERGTEGLNDIAQSFGQQVLDENGELNREKLGHVIFSDQKKRKLLNQILHPRIREHIISQKVNLIEENEPLIVLDIPLLFEANYRNEVDAVMVVYLNRDIQMKRLIERNTYTPKEAESRINAQMDLEKKKQLADIVIDNSRTIDETYEQVYSWLSRNGYITA